MKNVTDANVVLEKDKKKKTLCLYQYPDAKPEINNWLKCFRDKIMKVNLIDERSQVVRMFYDEQLLLCDISEQNLEAAETVKWDKILIFGRIPIEQDWFLHSLTKIKEQVKKVKG